MASESRALSLPTSHRVAAGGGRLAVSRHDTTAGAPCGDMHGLCAGGLSEALAVVCGRDPDVSVERAAEDFGAGEPRGLGDGV
jgi:hypothetical protein